MIGAGAGVAEATGPGGGANIAGCVPGSSVTVTPFATKPFTVKAPIKP